MSSFQPNMRTRIPHYRALLSSFSSSQNTFKILHSLPTPPSASPTPPTTLLTLDSSFNPPTNAHFRLCTTALSTLPPSLLPHSRILLLLATTNADKAPKPASFEERLVMMEIFASSLLSHSPAPAGIDIAVTKHPYFVDKSRSIEASGDYALEGNKVEQVHLIGFDTLTRLLDTKYYAPEHRLGSLVPFLEKHRLLVTYRTDDKWGSRGEQDKYIRSIAEGELDGVGGRKEWVGEGRIRMVEGRREGEEVVSSTKVREAVRKGDKDALKGLVTEGVAEWVLEEGLYLEDD